MATEDPVVLKSELRRDMLHRRSMLTRSEREQQSLAICEHLWSKFIEPKRSDNGDACTLMGYAPFRNEVNIVPLLERCWNHGIQVVLPKVDAHASTMSLYAVASWNELVPGAWGIPEPSTEGRQAWNPAAEGCNIHWVIVPGVAFDRHGGRLGYGGGFYDRFFSGMRREGRPMLLAPAYNEQIVNVIPMEQFDQRVDAVITEQQIYRHI